MTLYSIGFVLFLVVFFAAQARMAYGLMLSLNAGSQKKLPDDECAKAAIILCLRGGDPFLGDCIDGVLQQDYPDFELRMVIDHESDPATEIALAALSRRPTVAARIDFLREPRPTCSLKCSSLCQAVDDLDDSFEIVAFIDADTVAHPTWLRELAGPLANAEVGAATGNRWYMPTRPSIGSMMRYVWNCAAIIQMHALKIAWGGTLAMRRETIDKLELTAKWGRAFCEDTMLFGELRKAGLQLEFVPSLMMTNRESCGVTGCIRWVCRQLLAAKLYHPRWPVVAVHGAATATFPIVALPLLSTAIMKGDVFNVALVALSVAGYVALLAVSLCLIERAVCRVITERGESARWLSPQALLYFVVSSPLLQILYPVALVISQLTRRVNWRGIVYRIHAPFEIEMLEYSPYSSLARDPKHSL